MSGIQQARVRRITTILAALGVTVSLIMLAAGAVSAAPGRNNDNAKLCRNWSSLYMEDGSPFVDRSHCTSYAAQGGTLLTSPPTTTTTTTTMPPAPLPNRVVVDAPSAAAGTYPASGAEFGIPPAGQAASLILVNDGTVSPTTGCSPLVGFPAGAIAVVDRGGCTDDTKASNAQAAGAVAIVVVNDVAGSPTTLQGADVSITISAVMVSQADGATIKAGLPATGSVSTAP